MSEQEAQALEGKITWASEHMPANDSPLLRVGRESLVRAEQANYVLWAWMYEPGMLVDSPRKRAGVFAMKQELIYNGFSKSIVVDLPAWGDAVTARTKEFQTAEGLQADGVIGRTTARHLFQHRAAAAEASVGIPDSLTCKQKSWESQNDPVCLGISQDEGIAQISPPNHPEISTAQMWDPAFAIPWMARSIKGSYIYVGGDWDGALAAYNVGASLAKKWVVAGKPATGGPQIGVKADGTAVFGWDVCSFYVAKVRGSLC